ncbi:Hypothetical predicted protein, partial [Marmota monax]
INVQIEFYTSHPPDPAEPATTLWRSSPHRGPLSAISGLRWGCGCEEGEGGTCTLLLQTQNAPELFRILAEMESGLGRLQREEEVLPKPWFVHLRPLRQPS